LIIWTGSKPYHILIKTTAKPSTFTIRFFLVETIYKSNFLLQVILFSQYKNKCQLWSVCDWQSIQFDWQFILSLYNIFVYLVNIISLNVPREMFNLEKKISKNQSLFSTPLIHFLIIFINQNIRINSTYTLLSNVAVSCHSTILFHLHLHLFH
jgi:hypothetical protein